MPRWQETRETARIGPFPNLQEFSASGSFVPAEGVRVVYVTGVGSGGGGGGGVKTATPITTAGGAGASGEAIYRKAVAVTPGVPVTVTIGAAGIAGTNGTASDADDAIAGGNGAACSFGSLTLAGGGGGGKAETPSTVGVGGVGGNGPNTLQTTVRLYTDATTIEYPARYGTRYKGVDGATGATVNGVSQDAPHGSPGFFEVRDLATTLLTAPSATPASPGSGGHGGTRAPVVAPAAGVAGYLMVEW